MSAQPAHDTEFKISNGENPAVFVNVGGMRTKRTRFGKTLVDVTDHDSDDQWRELLPEGSVKSARIEGEGVFKDSPGEDLVRAGFFNDEKIEMEFTFPSWGRVRGLFQITQLDTSSTVSGEVTYSIAVDSAGRLVWTSI